MATFLFEPSSKDITTNSCTQILQEVIEFLKLLQLAGKIITLAGKQMMKLFNVSARWYYSDRTLNISNLFSVEKYRYQKERISDQILEAEGSRSVQFLWDEHKWDLLLCGTLSRKHAPIVNAIKKYVTQHNR